MIDVFPAHQQAQIRQQLAGSIKAVVSQRLVPMTNKGRVAATEVMIANHAIRNLIREAKTHQIDNVIQTSGAEGMMLMETSLVALVRQGKITQDRGREFSFRKDEYDRLMGGG
jgi:twitching motility protein PilT